MILNTWSILFGGFVRLWSKCRLTQHQMYEQPIARTWQPIFVSHCMLNLNNGKHLKYVCAYESIFMN